MKRLFVTFMIACMMIVQVPVVAFASEECEHNWMNGGVCEKCDAVCEHVWDVDNIQFSWGEDCYAQSVCTVCKFPVEQICTVTEERTESTCTAEGKVTQTATIVIDGTSYQGQNTYNLDLADHEYESDVCIHCGDVFVQLEKPVIKVSASAGGVKISWSKIDKADTYVLYRKGISDWKKIAELSSSKLSYTDKDLVLNRAYQYRLKAVAEVEDERFESEFSAVVKHTASKIYAPVTVKAERTGYQSVKVSWSRVYPATGYDIYRSTTGKTGSFKKVKTITSAATLSWKNTGLVTGTKYYFKVRPFYGSNASTRKYGSYSVAKYATPNLSKPVMKTTTTVTGSTIKVSWNKVSYANGYHIYRKTTSGSWKNVGIVKGNTTFSFKDSPSAGIYQYSVKAYRTVNAKKVYSDRSAMIQTRTLKSPTVTVKAVDDEFKNKVTWTKITGATEYQISQKVEGGSWKILETRKASLSRAVIVAAPHGQNVSFRVRAIYKKDGVTTYGTYSKVKTNMISYAPYYSVSVPSAAKSKMQYITLTISNEGKCKMKILKEGAIMDPSNEKSEKEMVLVNSSTNKVISSLTINPGETKKVKLKVASGTTKYNQYYMVGFSFHYDGRDYVGVSSAYYGSYYQEVIL